MSIFFRGTYNSIHNTIVVDLVEFEDSGHALLDGSFDLVSVMRGSEVFQDLQHLMDDTTPVISGLF